MIDRRFFECVNQSSAISGAQSFSVRSRFFERESRCETERLVDHFEMCITTSSFSKCHATRDWNRKGSSCGGILGQLWHEVLLKLWPKANRSYFKLVPHNCHYLTSVYSDEILLESQRSEVKECFPRATARHNSKQSSIHHTSSPELSFSLVFSSLRYRISGSTPSLLARHSQRFKKNIIGHIHKIMKKIELCGVARAFVQISAKWPAFQKVWPPLA